MLQAARAGIPASLFAVVLAIVMVGAGVLFDRMAAAVPEAPVRVAVLDRVPPSRVEPATGPWEAVPASGGPLIFAVSTPQSAQPVAGGGSAQENTPVRASARRGEKKKANPAVFGPRPTAVEPPAPDAEFTR